MSALHFREILGAPPSIEWIALDSLLVDESYQRSADTRQSASLIAAIAQGWDWRLCSPLMVSRRGDDLWVIDGQHRLRAARERGDIGFLPCSVSRYASAAEEAQLFRQVNQHRKALTALDLFRAACAAGDGWSIKAAELIAVAGLSVSTHTNTAHLAPGALINVRGIVDALKRHGSAPVGAALLILGSAFADQQLRRAGLLFEALLQLAIHPPESGGGGGATFWTPWRRTARPNGPITPICSRALAPRASPCSRQ
jgi:hypothetical protein